MKPITTMKHDVVFDVADMGKDDINNFCVSHYNGGDWEEHTFIIFDKYKNPKKVMVDMGGWLGITPMYCSEKFAHVVTYECDKEALKRFKANLDLNPKIKNISIREKAVWENNTAITFGCKKDGQLGDSESSVFYNSNIGNDTLLVQCETLLDGLNHLNINPRDVSFIKMDIEGAEKVVVDNIISILKFYKPTLYLSIHHHLLATNDIMDMLDRLFNIYPHCVVYNKHGDNFEVNRAKIVENQLLDCVFTTEIK
jgi:FkbM family methyltransferase